MGGDSQTKDDGKKDMRFASSRVVSHCAVMLIFGYLTALFGWILASSKVPTGSNPASYLMGFAALFFGLAALGTIFTFVNLIRPVFPVRKIVPDRQGVGFIEAFALFFWTLLALLMLMAGLYLVLSSLPLPPFLKTEGLFLVVYFFLVLAIYKRFSRSLLGYEAAGGVYAASDTLLCAFFIYISFSLSNVSKLTSGIFMAIGAVCLAPSLSYLKGAIIDSWRSMRQMSRRDWGIAIYVISLTVLAVLYAHQKFILEDPRGTNIKPRHILLLLWTLWLYAGVRNCCILFNEFNNKSRNKHLYRGLIYIAIYLAVPFYWAYEIYSMPLFGSVVYPKNTTHLSRAFYAFSSATLYSCLLCMIYAVIKIQFFSSDRLLRKVITFKRLHIASVIFTVFVAGSLFSPYMWRHNFPLRVRVCHHLSEAQCRVIGVDKTPVHENGYFVGYDYSYRTR